MKDILNEPKSIGKTSLSRLILLVSFMFVSVMFILVFIGLVANWWAWERFSGALTWAVAFVFTTALPYIGNVLGGERKNEDLH